MMAVFTNQQTDHRGWSEPLGDAWIMKHQISSFEGMLDRKISDS